MKQITGWWFGTTDRKLGYTDNRGIIIGGTHTVKGEIVPCFSGLHLSKRIIGALSYARGPVIYKVRGSGVIVSHGNPVDKYACSKRTYIAGGIDASETLRKFARLCALDVLHLWDAPDTVIEYLKTGDENLRSGVRDAADSAAELAEGMFATKYAAWSTLTTVWYDDPWTVAKYAAESSYASAWNEGEDERKAIWKKQNTRLTRMVNRIMRQNP